MTHVLPAHFCWTRFGVEAGERVDDILVRKERERLQNGGVFLWGIGNALGPSMRELLRREAAPEVIFSPIVSAPRQADVSPSSVVTWRAGRDLDGSPVELPKWSKVTSRASDGARLSRHYALVCHSDVRLVLDADPPTFSMGCLENLLTSRQVGASQVTAVVRHVDRSPKTGASYRLALRARLVAPFFVELAEPEPLDASRPSRASRRTPYQTEFGVMSSH